MSEGLFQCPRIYSGFFLPFAHLHAATESLLWHLCAFPDIQLKKNEPSTCYLYLFRNFPVSLIYNDLNFNYADLNSEFSGAFPIKQVLNL
jgi:hypothetical protein